MTLENKYKTFNHKLGQFDLNPDFIISISHSDGFSERLLNYEIFIDKNYNFHIQLQSFKGSLLNIDTPFNLQLSSRLPKYLESQIIVLFSENFKDIKSNYAFESLSICDVGFQEILINMNGKTKTNSIEDSLKNFKLINKNEKRLEKLNFDIKNWIENLYLNITE